MVQGLQTAEDQERLQRIVGMAVLGVPDAQIAEVVGCDPSRVAQLRQSEAFKELYAETMAERIAEKAAVDEGWDDVEKRALEIVSNTLKFSKNPDYALKAAMVANRAQRRAASPGNNALPGDMGARVVINLNQTFVDKLQNVAAGHQQFVKANRPDVDLASGEIEGQVTKRVSLLSPASVEKLLSPQPTEFENAFDELMLQPAEPAK